LRVKRQLEQVKRYMNEFMEFRKRGEHAYACERSTQLLIQSLLDLGAMLSTFLGEAKSDTYRGIAKYLSGKLRLSAEEEGFLESLTGFRNILVHGYVVIDRKLEERAFSEIEGKLPKIVGRMGSLIDSLQVDPFEGEGLKRLASVFERHEIYYALLFGSTARGEAGRDYDIAVSAKMGSALELGKLLVEVAEALNVHEDRVDLVLLEYAPKHLIHTIVLEGKVIYGNPEEAYLDLTKHYIEYLDINETLQISEKK